MTIENTAATALVTFAYRTNDAYAPIEPETPVELYTAPLMQRVIARVIDDVVFLVAGVVARACVIAPMLVGQTSSNTIIAAVILSLTLPWLPEAIVTGFGGQSFGKRIMKLRVVRNDGGPIGLGRSFARVYSLPAIAFVLTYLYIEAGGDESVLAFAPMIIQGVQLVLVWTEKSRVLADHLAGTRVIDANTLPF